MADAVGADHAFFSTCGSSLSVKSAMLSVAGPEEKLLLAGTRTSRWSPGSSWPAYARSGSSPSGTRSYGWRSGLEQSSVFHLQGGRVDPAVPSARDGPDGHDQPVGAGVRGP